MFKVTDINAGIWISILNWLGVPLVSIYLFSMFVLPWFNGDWNHVLNVWNHWQSLNVGVLAFVSSLIAFNISRYNADKQREREFIASRAFLPAALSQLTVYTKECAKLLEEARVLKKNRDGHSEIAVTTNMPSLEESINGTFSDCIRHGAPDVAEHLAAILVKLQVNDSRLTSLSSRGIRHSSLRNINVYMYCLAEIQAMINATFSFARGKDTFKNIELSIESIETAYSNLDIHSEMIDGLTDFTQSMLGKKNA